MLHVKDILNSRIEDYMELVDNPDKLDKMKVNTQFHALDDVL